MKTNLLYMCAIGISIVLLFFVIGCTWIGYEVKTQCQQAKRIYSGNSTGKKDCIDTLITLLEDDKQSFRAKNNAIWALGELGDIRALPTLQRLYTGIIPDREPLDKTVSQYELKKAVNLVSGGFNITAFVWRSGFVSINE